MSGAVRWFPAIATGYRSIMDRQEEEGERLERDNSPDPKAPPDASEHPSHEEEVGGAGAEDPDEMADEERYRKGPGW